MRRKNSELGIASLIMSGAIVIISYLGYSIIKSDHFFQIFSIAMLFMSLVAFCFGVASLFLKNRKKLFAILGLALSIIDFCANGFVLWLDMVL